MFVVRRYLPGRGGTRRSLGLRPAHTSAKPGRSVWGLFGGARDFRTDLQVRQGDFRNHASVRAGREERRTPAGDGGAEQKMRCLYLWSTLVPRELLVVYCICFLEQCLAMPQDKSLFGGRRTCHSSRIHEQLVACGVPLWVACFGGTTAWVPHQIEPVLFRMGSYLVHSFFCSFQGSERFDTSRKMRPPAWTDRVLYSPSGPHAVSPLKYTSVPDSCHSDHRPVYAKFRVQLAD